jgi:high-affinity Fe2+/Pb2+ permease
MPGMSADLLMLGWLLYQVAHRFAGKDNFRVAMPVMYAAVGMFWVSILMTLRIVLLAWWR